jgi:hypothetical protein
MDGLLRSIAELKGPLQTLLEEHRKVVRLVAFQRSVNEKKKRLLVCGLKSEELRVKIEKSGWLRLSLFSDQQELRSLEQEMALLKKQIQADTRSAEARLIKAMKTKRSTDEAKERFQKINDIPSPFHERLINDAISNYRQPPQQHALSNDFKKLALDVRTIPTRVILLTNAHGSLAGMRPFIVPCTVERHLATDLGTFNYKCRDKQDVENKAMSNMSLKGEMLIKRLEDIVEEHRTTIHKKKLPENYQHKEERTQFLKSRHHRKSKVFRKGTFMLNRLYDPSDRDNGFFLRDMDDSDFFYELEKKKTTLYAIVYLLHQVGVEHIFLYDTSCAGEYDLDPRDYALFGGAL